MPVNIKSLYEKGYHFLNFLFICLDMMAEKLRFPVGSCLGP